MLFLNFCKMQNFRDVILWQAIIRWSERHWVPPLKFRCPPLSLTPRNLIEIDYFYRFAESYLHTYQCFISVLHKYGTSCHQTLNLHHRTLLQGYCMFYDVRDFLDSSRGNTKAVFIYFPFLTFFRLAVFWKDLKCFDLQIVGVTALFYLWQLQASLFISYFRLR